MSGANCGSGCTDCPACRGEVRPEAPVMKDMAFAMEMGEDGLAGSGPWGALGVLGLVREGIRARGGSSPDDVRMSRWIDQNTFQLSAGADRRAPSAIAAYVERSTTIVLDDNHISFHTIGASAPRIQVGFEGLGSANTRSRQEIPPRRKKGGGGGGPAKPTDADNWTKDCFWHLEGQPGRPLGYYPKDPSDPKKPEGKWVLVCAGARGKGKNPGFKEITEGWSQDGCKYYFIDNPTFSLNDGPFHIKISWEGRIWDNSCRKTLKKVKYFTVEVEGRTTNGVPDPAAFKGSVTSGGKKTEMGKLEKSPDEKAWEPPALRPDEDVKCR